jgi:hypothetical protein
VDLDVQPPVWGPDGDVAAVWGHRLASSGNYTDHLLYVVSLPTHVGWPIASGIEQPGSVVFSSDASYTAHLYGERLFRANAAATTLAASARRAAVARPR